MDKNSAPLVDEHLQSIRGMSEAGPDDFFYTRLKARLEKDNAQKDRSFPLRPVWVVGILALLLAANGFMLVNQSTSNNTTSTVSTSSLQNFAESYDQSISSY
jgi:hypothetical protein